MDYVGRMARSKLARQFRPPLTREEERVIRERLDSNPSGWPTNRIHLSLLRAAEEISHEGRLTLLLRHTRPDVQHAAWNSLYVLEKSRELGHGAAAGMASKYKRMTFPDSSVLMAKLANAGILGKSKRMDRYYRAFAESIAVHTLFSFDILGTFKAVVDKARLTPEEYYQSARQDFPGMIHAIAPGEFADQAVGLGLD